MSFIFKGREILTDAEGYLSSADDWSPELMAELAAQMGIELDERRRAVITAVRDYYAQYAAAPPMRGLIALLKKRGQSELASSIVLAELFPDGAAKSAAKLAGLPKPVHCI